MDEPTLEERVRRLERISNVLQVGQAHLHEQIAELLVRLPTAVQEGTRAGLKEFFTDPKVLEALGASAIQIGRKGLHLRAGELLFSKWAALFGFLLVVGQTMGWGVVVKAALGLAK